MLGPERVDTAEVRAAGQPQVHVPDGVGELVAPYEVVQPVLGDGPALREQRLDRVDHVRPVQQPGDGQLPYDGGRFAVPAADGLAQQAAYDAGCRRAG